MRVASGECLGSPPLARNHPLLTGIAGCAIQDMPLCRPHRAPVAQLDRASDYESEGRTFESFRARHFLQLATLDRTIDAHWLIGQRLQ
jgi:hypothetical protein